MLKKHLTRKSVVRRHMREQNGIATLENHFLIKNYIEIHTSNDFDFVLGLGRGIHIEKRRRGG